MAMDIRSRLIVCPSVCLSVCPSVCSYVRSITQKRVQKVSKLGIGMTLGYPRSGMVLEDGISKVKVTRSISAFYSNDYYVYVINANLTDNSQNERE